MANVIGTHGISDMEKWLAAEKVRKPVFANFCSSYRYFKHTDDGRISIYFENVDLEKMKSFIDNPEARKRQADSGVTGPIDLYVEFDAG